MKEIITFEPPETVVVILQGKLDPDEFEKVYEKWETYKAPNGKFKLLVDCSELEEIPPKVREIMRKRTNQFKLTKMAAYGASTKIRLMGGLIIKMIPNIDASKFVSTEAEARAWLEEK